MWCILTLVATALVLLTSFTLHFLSFVFQRKYITGVPIAKDEQHWFWGLARLVMPIDGLLDSHAQLHRLSEKYGPLFQFYVLWNHVLHVTDGRLAKYIMDKVARGKGVIHRRNRDVVVKNILVLNTNDDWRRRRTQFRQAFTITSLRAYSDKMHTQVTRLMQQLRHEVVTQPEGVVKIDALYSRFALDAIFQLGFELDENFLGNETHFDEVNTAIQDFFQLVWLNNIPFFRPFVFSSFSNYIFSYLPRPVQRYKKAFRILRDVRQRVLRHLRDLHARKAFQSDCFGKLLLDFAESEENLKTGLREMDLESELLVFMLAGHETTAHSLSFFTYALAANPECLKQCQQEIKTYQITGNNIIHNHNIADRNRSNDNTHNANSASNVNNNNNIYNDTDSDAFYSVLTPLPPYVEACIKESMRKFPVAARGSLRLQLSESDISPSVTHQNNSNNGNNNRSDKWRSNSSKNNVVLLDVRHLQLPSGVSQISVSPDTMFHINIFSLHNSRVVWGEDADRFRPERWLWENNNSINSSNGNNNNGTDSTNNSTPNKIAASSIGLSSVGAYAGASRLYSTKNTAHNTRSNITDDTNRSQHDDNCNRNHSTNTNASFSTDTDTDTKTKTNNLESVSDNLGAWAEELVFLPFSYGPRNCIGMNFALWEMRSVIFAMLSEVDTIVVPTDRYPALQEEETLLQTDMITMKPLLQLPLRITLKTKTK